MKNGRKFYIRDMCQWLCWGAASEGRKYAHSVFRTSGVPPLSFFCFYFPVDSHSTIWGMDGFVAIVGHSQFVLIRLWKALHATASCAYLNRTNC